MQKTEFRICLVAINSKYIHTNPAVSSLNAYAGSLGISCDILEGSVNQPEEELLAAVMEKQADLYAFSVYIWNTETVFHLTESLKKLRPGAEIWCGGPEVSYDAAACLLQHPELRGILRGEGEESFSSLAKAYFAIQNKDSTLLSAINGITFRNEDGQITETKDRAPMNLSTLVFPYTDTETPDPNRILYYESSRGCPFLCSYCLSCLEKKLRFKPLPMVTHELSFFLRERVKQVKFVDRTFNANEAHAMAIWQYLKEHDNGITNFHFEICAELLSDDAIALLNSLRPGQVQLEIGVQTTNPETLTAIRRTRDADKLTSAVSRLVAPHNIHVHLDLIAGLPFEDLPHFAHSFNEVYAMQPHQLQLGFLKVLKGTPMEQEASQDGYLVTSRPPYEVLTTPWLSYKDLRILKGIESMVETYYNSHQFEKTMSQLLSEITNPILLQQEEGFSGHPKGTEVMQGPFLLYLLLSSFMHTKGHDKKDHGRMERYELLLDFIRSLGLDTEAYIPLLLYDFCARERLKHWPAWAGCHEKPTGFDYEHKDPITGNYISTG